MLFSHTTVADKPDCLLTPADATYLPDNIMFVCLKEVHRT